MARGLRIDAVALQLPIVRGDDAGDSRFAGESGSEGGRKGGGTVFYFVRAPRRVAALPSRIYRIQSRTNYRVPVNERAILLHGGKS